MDINDFRAWHTVAMFAAFIAIVLWAFSKRRKSSFNEAANLPFADENRHEASVKKETDHE